MALAIASSCRDQEVAPQTAAVGEIGLSGEIRKVSQLERRLGEAARLGFTKCFVPAAGDKVKPSKDIQVIPVGSVREAIAAGLVGRRIKDPGS